MQICSCICCKCEFVAAKDAPSFDLAKTGRRGGGAMSLPFSHEGSPRDPQDMGRSKRTLSCVHGFSQVGPSLWAVPQSCVLCSANFPWRQCMPFALHCFTFVAQVRPTVLVRLRIDRQGVSTFFGRGRSSSQIIQSKCP